MEAVKWSKKEKELLREEYPVNGADYVSKILNRSKNAVYVKANEMDIKSRKCGSGIKWNPKEIKILEKKYPFVDTSKLSLELSRTEKSIRNKAAELGIVKKKKLKEEEKIRIKHLFKQGFSVREIERKLEVPMALIKNTLCNKKKLEMLYHGEGLTQQEIAEKLDLNQPFVSEKMKENGIETRSHEAWTKKEEKVLRENYLETSKEKLLSLLPKRTWSAIKAKALKLGISRPLEEYRKSDEVKKKLRSLAEENMIEVDFEKKEVLSYVMGVIDGDGFHDREHTIGLEVKSPEFANKFAEKLKKLGLNPGRGNREDRQRETVWASSKQLIKWYMDLSKEEKLEWLEEEGSEWDYIEGRYESDGNIHPSGGLRIVSYDGKELSFLEKLFSKLDIGCRRQKFNLWISRTSAGKFFAKTNPVLRSEEDHKAIIG